MDGEVTLASVELSDDVYMHHQYTANTTWEISQKSKLNHDSVAGTMNGHLENGYGEMEKERMTDCEMDADTSTHASPANDVQDEMNSHSDTKNGNRPILRTTNTKTVVREEESIKMARIESTSSRGGGQEVVMSTRYVVSHDVPLVVQTLDVEVTATGDTSDSDSSGSGQDLPSPKVSVYDAFLRTAGTESHENPFLADGELAKKAEYIVRHSTISRTEIRISDPDLHKNATVTASPEEVIVSESTPLNAAPPPSTDPKENGQLEKAVKAKPVEAEVGKANASQPEPQQAEQVKLKDNKKCKCCVVQ